ncbi:hypothetical protein [Nesterenkonia pannonica]|uniref:hypothetical protein n=1 Tax=Nesterenkonia pannonica TaxID=1548602 RepID=UPI002164BD9C|nr:hypothetical protein [Nesterenkonia pannonica]
MQELAIGHILIPDGDETLTGAAETAQGLVSVGMTDRGPSGGPRSRFRGRGS